MAENKNVKYVNVFIPEDSLNEWETAKTVTVNGVTYVIPTGENVEVPYFVAEVINNWLESVKKARADYKKRMKELEDSFK